MVDKLAHPLNSMHGECRYYAFCTIYRDLPTGQYGSGLTKQIPYQFYFIKTKPELNQMKSNVWKPKTNSRFSVQLGFEPKPENYI